MFSLRECHWIFRSIRNHPFKLFFPLVLSLAVLYTGLFILLYMTVQEEDIARIFFNRTKNNILSFPSTNAHRFTYRFLNDESAACARTKPFLLTIVHSAPVGYKRRQYLRQSWANAAAFHRLKTLVLFFTARHNETVDAQVAREANRYRDIIQVDYVDSYQNLTFKAMAWLKWTTLYCRQAEFVLKIDDDIFVEIDHLLSWLKLVSYRKRSQSKRSFILDNCTKISCNVWNQMPVSREGKWKVPTELYAPDIYPPYCSGSAYMITNDVVPELWQKSQNTSFFWIDDVFITGFLPQNVSIQYVDKGQMYIIGGSKAQVEEDRTKGKLRWFSHNGNDEWMDV